MMTEKPKEPPKKPRRVYNKRWYTFGNPFKLRFREHRCFGCGRVLDVIRHRKIVDQTSEEAVYYNFSAGKGRMIGACEFIHKVFFCATCDLTIENQTQLGLEDIDLNMEKVIRYFAKKGVTVTIEKYFVNSERQLCERPDSPELTPELLLRVTKDGRTAELYFERIRSSHYERPYYFWVTKSELKQRIRDIQ